MYIKIAHQIINLLERAFSTFYAWILTALVTFTNIVLPEKFSFLVVLTAIVADAIWGIAVAVKFKKYTLSKLLRVTFFKISSYGFCLYIVLLIEMLAHDTNLIGVKLVAAIAGACELWSMSASMLIIYPDFPFLKLFRRQLKGEIASKTGKNVDDIFKED